MGEKVPDASNYPADFTLRDALLLLAAFVVGLAINRAYWPFLQESPYFGEMDWEKFLVNLVKLAKPVGFTPTRPHLWRLSGAVVLVAITRPQGSRIITLGQTGVITCWIGFTLTTFLVAWEAVVLQINVFLESSAMSQTGSGPSIGSISRMTSGGFTSCQEVQSWVPG